MTTSVTTTGRMGGLLRHRRVEFAVLLCMCAIYFFAYFQRIAVPGTIFNELQTTFRASAGQVALLGALYLYIYGGMQLFAGMLNDRFGAVRIILIGGLLLSIGALAFPLAHTLPLLYLARALVGLGSSLIFISVVKAIDMLFPPELFPPLLGLIMFLGCCGGLSGTLPFDRAVNAWGWQPTLLGIGILSTLAFLVSAVLFSRTAHVTRHDTPTSPRVIFAILRNRHSLPMLLSAPVNFALYFLLQATIGKKFIQDYCGMSDAGAASFTFVMMLITTGIALAGGFSMRLFGDRRKPVMLISIGFTIAGFALTLLFIHLGIRGGWLLICYILLAFSTFTSPVGNTLMKELNPPEAVGTSIGATNAASYIGVALLTTMAGAIMDHFKHGASAIYPPQAYLTIFAICLAIAVVAFVSALFIRETYGKAVYGEEN
ncbi:MAG: MFS transporter [Armatimonadota bacterium]